MMYPIAPKTKGSDQATPTAVAPRLRRGRTGAPRLAEGTTVFWMPTGWRMNGRSPRVSGHQHRGEGGQWKKGHELTEVGRERLRSVGVDGSVRGRIRHDMSQLRRIAPKSIATPADTSKGGITAMIRAL